MSTITLPWPFPALWPNKRPHWSAKARATRAYRFTAKCLALGSDAGPIRVTYCPKPLGPTPDLDNCIAAFKAAQDGLADAFGVNDRDLIVTYRMGERCKDGAVIVEIGVTE